MSLATDFTSGFNMTYGAATAYKDRKDQKLRQSLIDEERLADKIREQDKAREARSAVRQSDIQKNLRQMDAQRADEERRAAAAADPREQLARAKASAELETVRNPPPLSDDERLKQKIMRMKLEKEFGDLSTPRPPAVPTARVKQPFGPGGKGMAEFDAPLDQLPSIMGANPAAAYKSPHARRLAELDRTIAAEQAQIHRGDDRGGFMGMSSRADTVATAQRERTQLLALELQDKVRAGILSQEDADAEADKILGGLR